MRLASCAGERSSEKELPIELSQQLPHWAIRRHSETGIQASIIVEFRQIAARCSIDLLEVSCNQNFPRSEERRVGKECRSRWWPYDSKKRVRVRGERTEW